MIYLDRRFLNLSFSVLGVLNQPPANPVNGSQVIVGAVPAEGFASASTNHIARFDGTAWNFTAPKAGEELLNIQTGEVLQFNGTAWVTILSIGPVKPVLAILPTGDTLPAACSEGDTFLNTADAKFYSATDTDTWDEGTATANGARYASTSDFNIYQSDGTALTHEAVPNGGLFLNKADGCIYVYDASVPAFVRQSGGSDYFTEPHTLTAAEAAAKTFSLTHSIATGQESNTLLFVDGIAQIAGTDFTASGSSISWDNKGLDHIGLREGDVLLVHYIKGGA